MSDLAERSTGVRIARGQVESVSRLPSSSSGGSLRPDRSSVLTDGRDIQDQAFAAARIGLWQCDLSNGALAWTDSVYGMFGIQRGAGLDRDRIVECYRVKSRQELDRLRSDAIAACGNFKLDAEIAAFDGQERWIRITASVESQGDRGIRLYGMKQDITEDKRIAERHRYLAEFDAMTGLANRSGFDTSLASLMRRSASRTGRAATSAGALLLIDLDGFKAVNDTYGHAAGDACLRASAERLRSVFRDAEIVARIGGDEFAVVLAAGVSPAQLECAGKRAVETLSRVVDWGGMKLNLSASVGIASASAANEAELFDNADAALYCAKAAGRNMFRLHVPSMSLRRADRLSRLAAG